MTPALRALQFTGRPWGPTAGSRGASTARRRSGLNVWPTVTTVSIPEVPATTPRNPRRDNPSAGASATVLSAGSAAANRGRRDGRVRARLVIIHLAPTWANNAPIVTQAIQKWVAVNEK